MRKWEDLYVYICIISDFRLAGVVAHFVLLSGKMKMSYCSIENKGPPRYYRQNRNHHHMSRALQNHVFDSRQSS